MNTYEIANPKSGVILGRYQGANEAAALEDFASDAGYANYETLNELFPAEITVTLCQ